MYTVYCDGFPLLDVRDEELILVNPKVKLEVNTVGEGSFKIYKNHPYYNKLQKLKSMFEISDEYGVLFRGRMTDSTRDFEDGMAVDLEGAMAFFNDSIVRPFSFPEDFLNNAEYNASSNKVEFFLKWLIDNHNSQVQDFQKFKLGTVTVADPNNYINRSNEGYLSTWEALKDKLFESSLGGYLCIRYEDDGNYIDYLSEFTETNAQGIEFGENLLGLVRETDATSTYSAIIPIGATLEGEPDKDGNIPLTLVTIESIADSNITDDIVKKGDTLYSKSAVAAFGWIYAPVDSTTWEDVTVASNLLEKGKEWLVSHGMMLAETVEVTAADMHFSGEAISSFRIYRKINVKSIPHGISETYNLTKLNLELLKPQNTKITVGSTKQKSFSDIQREQANKYDNAISGAQAAVIALQNSIKKIEHLLADTITTKNLAAEVAELGYLSAESADLIYASIEELNAAKALIEQLETNKLSADEAAILYASIESLDALSASIKDLETNKLSAKDAEITYANIDFSNIGEAAMEYFYSQSGLIKNVIVGDQTITGELVGVTIKGDLIQGNTIVADKLVILGTDGLYYKLNTNGVSTQAEQTEYNSLNGKIITAKSITAEKVSVSDLVAFDATIGGFKITDSSIYSGVKSSVSNTTRGIYMDKEGQWNVGDASNFIKYYKENGVYKLAISASSIIMSSSSENLEETLSGTVKEIIVEYALGDSPTIPPEGGSSVRKLGKPRIYLEGADVLKLEAPTIRLDSNGNSTSSVLGEAVLGQMVLGTPAEESNAVQLLSFEETFNEIATYSVESVWSTTPPTRTNGQYIWQRITYIYADGTIVVGSPICITGDKGDAGATGAQGQQGEQGVPGEKGDKGDTGTQGIQGEKGDKGDKGATGSAGKDAVVYRIESSLGTAFLETQSDTTVLTARIYKGAAEIDSSGAYGYTWYVVAKDGTERVIGNGKSLSILSSTIAGKGVYFIADDGGAEEEMVQLETPIIEMVEVENKLDDPFIQLMEVVEKLDAPIIELKGE